MKALILNNQVVELSETEFEVAPTLQWVDCDNTITIEHTYENGNFIAPQNNVTFDEAINNLRLKRNYLLQETDYLALSDQTMTAEMTAYRQALRDITNGLSTVEEVEAVVFPEKPEA
jgi:hypothetical protein